MLDKSEFYHGAAIIRLIDDDRCDSVRHMDHFGYIVNNTIFLLLRYTTKGRSPWGFNFDQDDVDRFAGMESKYTKLIIGLICGGDGICAITWEEAKIILAGRPGRIAIERKHHKSYSVWGSADELGHKIAAKYWPSLLFETG